MRTDVEKVRSGSILCRLCLVAWLWMAATVATPPYAYAQGQPGWETNVAPLAAAPIPAGSAKKMTGSAKPPHKKKSERLSRPIAKSVAEATPVNPSLASDAGEEAAAAKRPSASVGAQATGTAIEQPAAGTAAAASPVPSAPSVPEACGPSSPPPEYLSAVQKFCSGITSKATEARIAWQQRTIADLEKEIEARIGRLEAKIAEHQQWLAKREQFAAKASNGLVQLIGGMNPDAAALQIGEMEEEMAAAIIMKLEPRTAAPLMAEVQPAKAARISSLIAAAAALNDRHEIAYGAAEPQAQQKQEGGAK